VASSVAGFASATAGAASDAAEAPEAGDGCTVGTAGLVGSFFAGSLTDTT
jgi:hypothetical protein